MNIIWKLRCFFKTFAEIYKYGGVSKMNISYVYADQQLKDKVVFITGGGSGIGKAIAKSCLKQGAKVIISGRNIQKLEDTVKEFSQEGLINIKSIKIDISKISIFLNCIKTAIEQFGKDIDILVNNAGAQPLEFFPNVSEKEWHRIYETNSKGTFFMCQEFCKYWMGLEEQKQGKFYKIINISSQGGFVGATYPYRMSKWDIVGLTAGLGKAMAHHNIIINSIAPGVVCTEMQKKYMNQGNNVYCNQNPMKRYAYPEEISELAIFLMSDRTNFITGQTIVCDGGFSLK